MLSLFLGPCMPKVKVCHKITSRLFIGIRNLPNREIQVLSTLSELFIISGKEPRKIINLLMFGHAW